MKSNYIIICFLLLFVKGALSQNLSNRDEKVDGQITEGLPGVEAGAKNTVINLNGIWKFSLNPPANFWINTDTSETWSEIHVPGECQMQGFSIKSDQEFAYRKEILIPASFKNKKLLIRFDGVYSYARVWVNGIFIREHFCGFTTWYCDITRAVTPGQKAVINVGVTDLNYDLSFGSGYAMHYIGGIISNVLLIGLPKDNLEKFYTETVLDKNYQNAILRVYLGMEFSVARNALVELTLKDPQGKIIPIHPFQVKLDSEMPQKIIDIPVSNPWKWDAEHPNLYTITASVVGSSKKEIQTIKRKIGFRQIEIIGNKFLVNGKQIKLRGVDRHTSHPLTGRSVATETDELDIKLLKQANVNFLRTSHYPPSEHLLDLCDRYGIYIEEENAICFLQYDNDFIDYVNDTLYTKKAINQLSEILDRDRNHPSIIIWSIGNENRYGELFAESYQFLKRNDPTRPVIFSFPGTAVQLKGKKCFDILSYHYPNTVLKGIPNDSIPVLCDEYAHPACYIKFTTDLNPGVRDYWGHSIEKFWDNMYRSEGCLGGAIWCWADEVFMLRDTCVGYGEWGIVDGWRRPKPEFWHTRKAYSPVKVKYDENLKSFTFFNRFDFTTFQEVKAKWSLGKQKGDFNLPPTHPHDSCKLPLPAEVSGNPDGLRIEFFKDSAMIDDFVVPAGRAAMAIEKPANIKVDFIENEDRIEVFTDNFKLVFNRSNGNLMQIIRSLDTTSVAGPYLEIGYNTYEPRYEGPMIVPGRRANVSKWKLSGIHASKNGNNVVLELNGKYEDAIVDNRNTGLIYNTKDVGFTSHITVAAAGTITFDYEVNVNAVNSNEIGLRFLLPDNFNQIEWDRKAQWNNYPADHIGRPKGLAYKYSTGDEIYRQTPTRSWSQDTYDWYLHGPKKTIEVFEPVTNDFKSSKENIYSYTVSNNAGSKITVIANGDASARMEVLKGGLTFLIVDNKWSYPLGWGNDEGDATIKQNFKGKVTLIINN